MYQFSILSCGLQSVPQDFFHQWGVFVNDFMTKPPTSILIKCGEGKGKVPSKDGLVEFWLLNHRDDIIGEPSTTVDVLKSGSCHCSCGFFSFNPSRSMNSTDIHPMPPATRNKALVRFIKWDY